MLVKVTKDTVKIVDEDYILNKGEYNVNRCYFEFSEEYTDDLVKKAIFEHGDVKVEMVIANNECNIPYEVLNFNTFELRVYAFQVDGDELILRYSPTYTNAYLRAGSYDADASQGEEITPSQYEQYEQALSDGLVEVNSKLTDVNTAIIETNNLDLNVSKLNKITTVALTKKDNTVETVQILDGAEGQPGEKGDPGNQGPKGDPGEPGRDGAIQYTAGSNVTIENDTISVDLSNYATKSEIPDISGKLDTSKVKNTTSTTSGDVYDVTYFNSAMASANNIIGNLNNLVTTEKSNLVGAINEVAGSSGGETLYLGDVEDFTTSNYLDLNTLNKGQYFISNRKGKTTLYVKLTNNNQEVTQAITLETPVAYNYYVLDMFSKVEDFVGFDTLFKINYVIISSMAYEISAKSIVVDFNTANNQIVISSAFRRLYVDTTTDNQTITGAKTFNTLPQSSVTPTSNNQLVNKKYVDDSIASAITDALGGVY